jgi:hypothetical protein
MADFIVPRTKLVEIYVTSTGIGSQFSMPPNLDDLNNALICGVAVATETSLVTAPSQRPNLVVADLALVALTLAKAPGSDKTFDTLPLYFCDRELNAGHWFLTKPFVWNPSASFISITGTGVAADSSVCLVFLYIPFDPAEYRRSKRIIPIDSDIQL